MRVPSPLSNPIQPSARSLTFGRLCELSGELVNTFSEYTILGELGRGTTGVVFEALDTRLTRRTALKVPLLIPESERSRKVERFLRECRALAYLTSEPGVNIPALHVVAEHEGQPFCVRELVDGRTLGDCTERGSLDLRTGLAVVAEVARVVHWVHGRGFAHRNLSLANVLIATNGVPKLIGFGRVALLAGSTRLEDGIAGISPEIDVKALQDMIGEFCTALRQPVPPDLEQIRKRGSVSCPEAVAETIGDYLRGTRPNNRLNRS